MIECPECGENLDPERHVCKAGGVMSDTYKAKLDAALILVGKLQHQRDALQAEVDELTEQNDGEYQKFCIIQTDLISQNDALQAKFEKLAAELKATSIDRNEIRRQYIAEAKETDRLQAKVEAREKFTVYTSAEYRKLRANTVELTAALERIEDAKNHINYLDYLAEQESE